LYTAASRATSVAWRCDRQGDQNKPLIPARAPPPYKTTLIVAIELHLKKPTFDSISDSTSVGIFDNEN